MIDLVLGINNFIELEAELSIIDLIHMLLNR